MEKKIHLYVSKKNIFTWLMAACLVYSAVARIVVFGFTRHAGTVGLWGQIVLPVAATILYLAIVLMDGKECFYRTSIPVCMMSVYCAICVANNVQGKLLR